MNHASIYNSYFERKYGMKLQVSSKDPHVILYKKKGDPEIHELDLLPFYPDVFSKLKEVAESK